MPTKKSPYDLSVTRLKKKKPKAEELYEVDSPYDLSHSRTRRKRKVKSNILPTK